MQENWFAAGDDFGAPVFSDSGFTLTRQSTELLDFTHLLREGVHGSQIAHGDWTFFYELLFLAVFVVLASPEMYSKVGFFWEMTSGCASCLHYSLVRCPCRQRSTIIIFYWEMSFHIFAKGLVRQWVHAPGQFTEAVENFHTFPLARGMRILRQTLVECESLGVLLGPCTQVQGRGHVHSDMAP